MRTLLGRWGAALLFTALLAPLARAEDLDVEGAKRRYEAQQQVADQAKAAYDREQARLDALTAQRAQVVRERDDAQSRVSYSQAQLDTIDRSISALQAQDRDLESALRRNRDDLASARSRLDSLRRDEEDRKRQKEGIEHEIRDLEQTLDELRRQSPPNQAAIDAAQRELDHQRRDLSDAEDRLRRVRSDISSTESQVNDLNARVDRDERQLRANQDEIASLDRQRDRWLIELGDARGALSRAQSDLAAVGRQIDLQTPVVSAARAESDRQAAKASELYAYYQQVVQSYNRALQRVYAQADAAAQTHAGKEAQERAPFPGAADGAQAGTQQGNAKGLADGAARDGVAGYRDGRRTGATNPALAQAYARGKADGEAAAEAKATAEDFPKGYDDALQTKLGAAPTNAQTVDVTDALPDDPGGNGPELSAAPLPVGHRDGPAFPAPSDVVLAPPAYAVPGVTVPARDNRYFDPPCDDVPLDEFKPKCRTRYDQSYAEQYAANYRRLYLAAYEPRFTAKAREAYDLALQTAHQDVYQAQQEKGAREQGALDGFAAALTDAKARQYAAGQAHLAATFRTGHLLLVRGVELVEEDGDGVLMPGEYAKVKLTIDNYGGQASPKARVKLRITGTTNAAGTTFETRDLPALAADTRTTLVGVTRIKAGTIPAGQAVKADGVLEAEGRTIHSFTGTATVHYPLELASLTLPRAPKLDETLKATLTFKNLRNVATPETDAVLATNPQVVTMPGGGKLKVPALEPGQTASVQVDVKPTFHVGENVRVPFQVQALKDEAATWYVQPFPQLLHVDRDASLLVFDEQHRELPSGTVTVRAGGRASFYVRFKFHAPSYRQGPFNIQAGRTSDPGIAPSNGSTTGAQLGSWSPGTSMGDFWMSWDVARNLAGKQGWVVVGLTEGGTTIHTLTLYLDIE